MNVGDKVASVPSIGTIVGVASNGLPIVEWPAGNGHYEYTPENAEDLLVVELPTPNEELKPDAEEQPTLF